MPSTLQATVTSPTAPEAVTAQAARTAPRVARFYRPELDVLRCLAFFLVFTSHALPFPHAAQAVTPLFAIQEGAAAGVPLFFILSSFLITELLLRERDATGTIHIGAFYVRRILRIWPLYFLALAVAGLLPHLVHGFDPISAYVVPFVLLSGNWVIVSHGWFHNPMLTPLWSTPVQEQFYLLWPLLAFFWGPRGILRVVAVLLPLAWLLDYALPAAHFPRSPVLFCNSINQFQFFALGAGLAVLLHGRPLRLSGRTRLVLVLAAMVAFFLSGTPFHFINDYMPATPMQTLAGYLCLDAGCVLLCLAFLGARMPAFTRPLIYLGKISFGLYIFHYTLLAVVAAAAKKTHLAASLQLLLTYVVTVSLAIVLASLSYRYFERPFLFFKDRFTFIRSRPA